MIPPGGGFATLSPAWLAFVFGPCLSLERELWIEAPPATRLVHSCSSNDKQIL